MRERRHRFAKGSASCPPASTTENTLQCFTTIFSNSMLKKNHPARSAQAALSQPDCPSRSLAAAIGPARSATMRRCRSSATSPNFKARNITSTAPGRQPSPQPPMLQHPLAESGHTPPCSIGFHLVCQIIPPVSVSRQEKSAHDTAPLPVHRLFSPLGRACSDLLHFKRHMANAPASWSAAAPCRFRMEPEQSADQQRRFAK